MGLALWFQEGFGKWKMGAEEIMMEQSFLGFFWPLAEVGCSDLGSGVPLGKVRHPTGLRGMWQAGDMLEDYMRNCKPPCGFYSLKAVWFVWEFWLLLSVPFSYCLCYLPSDKLLIQQSSSAKRVGTSPLPYGTWSIISALQAVCVDQASLTTAAALLTFLPDLDEPVLTVHQTISDVRGSFYQEKTVFLRCTVNSNPPARFIWKRGAETLSHSQDNGVDIYEPLYTQVKKSKPPPACIESLADAGHSVVDGVSFSAWITMLGRVWGELQGVPSPKVLVEPTSLRGFPGYKRSRAAGGSVTAWKYLPIFGTVPEGRSQLP